MADSKQHDQKLPPGTKSTKSKGVTWESLGLLPNVQKVITDVLQFTSLTPVQAATIPNFLTHKDVAVEVWSEFSCLGRLIPRKLPKICALTPNSFFWPFYKFLCFKGTHWFRKDNRIYCTDTGALIKTRITAQENRSRRFNHFANSRTCPSDCDCSGYFHITSIWWKWERTNQ